ncbi:acyl carrier protein [Candidatus Anaplasma sp. TIGMIC]|uniref:acyl carrier protein n=1 Tax=Candidatus Anaplasma sp. TIGMIC TaxID=3020713 RepID=UPI00232B67FD|nr:phosphopantetheine-binding protein [Candidatus Anaplasma sp. TIGMIC]MDB1135059.1 phosphopantetheine-binding protein [Candidatus Anaplasma sp. TIGMIC]
MEGGETRGEAVGVNSAKERAVNVGLVEEVRPHVMASIIECLKLKDEQKDMLCGTTNLAKDFNLDSLDFVDLIMSLEERFSIHISDEDAQKLETVDDICHYIASKSDSDAQEEN